MASSLDDMPPYEHFQLELDALLNQFVAEKQPTRTDPYHFFIEFITFHCQYEKRQDITGKIVQEFVEWYGRRSGCEGTIINTQAAIEEFLLFIKKQNNSLTVLQQL